MGSPGTVDLYNDAVEKIGDQTYDWVNDNHRVALLGSGYTITQTHSTWADVSGQEVTGTNYVAGGKDMVNEAINTATDGTAKYDADDDSWTGSTITARYAVVVVGLAATTTGTDPLVCVVALDTTTDVSSTAGTFKVQWNADGLFTLS
jgi:hypothetical protein